EVERLQQFEIRLRDAGRSPDLADALHAVFGVQQHQPGGAPLRQAARGAVWLRRLEGQWQDLDVADAGHAVSPGQRARGGASSPTPRKWPNSSASLRPSPAGSGGFRMDSTLARRCVASQVPNSTTSTPGSCLA